MWKWLGILFCFWNVHAVSGQADTLLHSGIRAKSYLDYYRVVALAEEAVVKGSYPHAIKQYREIFEAYPYNNPVDCYLAAQVAAYAGDTVSCMRFLYKGLQFGLPVSTIAGNPHLAGSYDKMDRDAIDSCRSLYEKRIDHEARAAMIALFKRDQSIVHGLQPGESLYDQTGYRLKDKYRQVWDSLVSGVMILTRTVGFPAQKVIGTQSGDDSLFRAGPLSVYALPLFIHHGNAWGQVAEILWTELLKGNITPQMYGVIYEHANGQDSYGTPVLYFASRYCQERKCKKLVRQKIGEINAARWKIGLCSYEVMQKKFESTHLYYQWRRKAIKSSAPVFDFQCDLGFQGRE